MYDYKISKLQTYKFNHKWILSIKNFQKKNFSSLVNIFWIYFFIRKWRGVNLHSRVFALPFVNICYSFVVIQPLLKWVSLVAQLVKNLPAMLETWVQSLGWEDPLKKGKATQSSILAWRISWSIQSMESQRVGHNWVIFTSRVKY